MAFFSVTTIYNLNLACQQILIEGKHKIFGTNLKSEKKILHVYLIFCAFEDFYCNVVHVNDSKHPCLDGVH